MARLEGKIACITGAGSGIGRSIAECFAAEGATVVAQDLRVEAAEETLGLLPDGDHLAVGGDVSDPDAVAAFFAAIEERFGRLDVQVNNAGVDRLPNDGFDRMLAGEGPQIRLMEHEAFTRMLAIHIGGTFACTQAAVGLMHEGGSVITMASIAGTAGWGPVHYSAAKGAILAFTRSAARELGGMGIRINAIAPGVIDTPMSAKLDDALLAPMVMMTPLGRKGTADEIATTALFLACDDSSFITGQSISPNGGIVTV
ncbi:MAG: 3-oxoacyl-ACP reductase [Acidimicrobiaceae bacterium]|nr:3-oxoacyl-ACP reductase [Acidimicrobiaceae bacterium]